MVPAFTIVTTIITIGVTALMIALFYRINDPARQRSRDDGGGDGTMYAADGGNRGDDGGGDSADDGGGGGK